MRAIAPRLRRTSPLCRARPRRTRAAESDRRRRACPSRRSAPGESAHRRGARPEPRDGLFRPQSAGTARAPYPASRRPVPVAPLPRRRGARRAQRAHWACFRARSVSVPPPQRETRAPPRLCPCRRAGQTRSATWRVPHASRQDTRRRRSAAGASPCRRTRRFAEAAAPSRATPSARQRRWSTKRARAPRAAPPRGDRRRACPPPAVVSRARRARRR